MSEVIDKPRVGRGRKPDDRPWTEDEENRLRRMKREGLGNDEIRRKLKRSRSAVIGKWDRMSGRHAERTGAPAPREIPSERRISLGGPAWSWPERFQS